MPEQPLKFIVELLEKGVAEAHPIEVKGRVLQVVGTIIKASVPRVKIGEICQLKNAWDEVGIFAEVVGFSQDAALLSPLGPLTGISSSTEVIPSGEIQKVPVGPKLLGRVLDGMGNPIDADVKGPLVTEDYYPLYADPPNPMERKVIDKPLSLGIKSIDGLLTCGEGQRMGVFAAAGVGKSTILGQIIRSTNADLNILALIGERGREVREFLEKDLGEEGMKRSVLVISTSDRPAMERLKAAYVATAIAEYFRDLGKKVLFMMDSVTRFARAQREIGLAAGEPPARRGFPPSVFSELPKLMERAGQSAKGSITALYTVLVEGDDMTEPVADETRSILDGHIILDRKMAEKNIYPAVNVSKSISRVMNAIVTPEHRQAAGKFRSLLSKYEEVELLVRIGEYQKGSDAETDEALDKIGEMMNFLKQGLTEKSSFDETVKRLKRVVG